MRARALHLQQGLARRCLRKATVRWCTFRQCLLQRPWSLRRRRLPLLRRVGGSRLWCVGLVGLVHAQVFPEARGHEAWFMFVCLCFARSPRPLRSRMFRTWGVSTGRRVRLCAWVHWRNVFMGAWVSKLLLWQRAVCEQLMPMRHHYRQCQ